MVTITLCINDCTRQSLYHFYSVYSTLYSLTLRLQGYALYIVEVLQLHHMYIFLYMYMHSLTQMQVPAVPVFIAATGVYEVDFQISVSCRDACIYTIRRCVYYMYGKLLNWLSIRTFYTQMRILRCNLTRQVMTLE